MAGLINVKTNAELDQMEKDAQQANPTTPGKDRTATIAPLLNGYLDTKWERAKRAKIQIYDKMLKNLRMRKGIYEQDKLAAIKQMEGSEVFMLLADTKCRSGEAWVRDIVQQPGGCPWNIEPRLIPDFPEEVEKKIYDQFVQHMVDSMVQASVDQGIPPQMDQIKQMISEKGPKLQKALRLFNKVKANENADEIKDAIEEQLQRGGWYQAFSNILKDICDKKAVFLKGPIMRYEKVRDISEDQQTHKPVVNYKMEAIPTWERRSQWSIYPSPESTNIQNGYLFDVINLTRADLIGLLDAPGYKNEEIRTVLREHATGGLNNWLLIDNEVEYLNAMDIDTEYYFSSDNIYALEFWGTINGQALLDYGLTSKEVPDPDLDYSICCWKIGNHIIKAYINEDKMGNKPFYKASYEEDQDCFWGKCVQELIKDTAGICNAIARGIVNNVGIACLPGDTIVYREGQDRKYSPITMKELWDKKNQHNSGLRRIKLRSLNEETGEFFGNRIVNVYNNGVQDVFEIVTEKGYKIKATGTHKFMNDVGEWQLLDDFCQGDLIAVNGQNESIGKYCIDCGKEKKSTNGVRCRKCASKIENSSWNKKQVAGARDNSLANENTARARYECQKDKKDSCEVCGDTLKLEIHHVDRNPYNNDLLNKRTLCSICHHGLHAREDSFGNPYTHKYLSYDRLVSIEFVGREEVFNLQVEGPNHNYVSNGYLSKNSGPQIEVNIDRMEPGASKKLWPLRVWLTHESDMITNSPAIKVYNITLNADKLIQIYNHFSKIADEESGIPAYSHGDSQVGGAGNTSSGLTMLMTASARGIKQVIMTLDENIISKSIEAQYFWNLENDKFKSLICDMHIKATGTTSMIARGQQAVRLKEFMDATNNPVDINIMGLEGRKDLIRKVAKANEITIKGLDDESPDDIINEIIADLFSMGQPGVAAPDGQPGTVPGQVPGGTPGSPPAGPGAPPPPSPTTLDNAGQPAQGQDNRLISQQEASAGRGA